MLSGKEPACRSPKDPVETGVRLVHNADATETSIGRQESAAYVNECNHLTQDIGGKGGEMPISGVSVYISYA